MSDKKPNPSDRDPLDSERSATDTPVGRSVSSPFDQPTERFTHSSGTTVPRTDEDLEPDATTQFPAYKATDDDATTAYAAAPSSSTRFDDDYDTASAPTVAQPVPVTPARASTGASTAATSTAAGSAASSRNWNVDDDEPRGRGTTDLGLLILRVAVGAIFVFHGLMKLTGWWGGPGLDGMKDAMAQSGWDQPQWTAIMVTVGELAGGGLLILGLATPLAGAAVLAVIIDAWLFRQAAEPGLQFTAPNGPEYETILVAASAALILTGPGKLAFDAGRGWARRPALGSLVCLILGIAAAACTWIFLHGGNPFV